MAQFVEAGGVVAQRIGGTAGAAGAEQQRPQFVAVPIGHLPP